MVEQVAAYKTSAGELFMDEKRALEQELRDKIRRVVSKVTESYAGTTVNAIMSCHKELSEVLTSDIAVAYYKYQEENRGKKNR